MNDTDDSSFEYDNIPPVFSPGHCDCLVCLLNWWILCSNIYARERMVCLYYPCIVYSFWWCGTVCSSFSYSLRYAKSSFFGISSIFARKLFFAWNSDGNCCFHWCNICLWRVRIFCFSSKDLDTCKVIRSSNATLWDPLRCVYFPRSKIWVCKQYYRNARYTYIASYIEKVQRTE